MNLFYEGIITLIATIAGVVIGGFITIRVNNITNTESLKKAHELSILQKIKELLQGWRTSVSMDVIKAFQNKDINTFQTTSGCNELRSLIMCFESNTSVLKQFRNHFEELRKRELSLDLKQNDIKSKLVSIANKHGVLRVSDLYEYTDAAKIWEDDYVDEILKISEGIDALIILLDLYIEKNILNLK